MKAKQTKIKSRNSIYGSVIDTIRRIGNEEPVIFQRDGGLVVASNAGFGMVNYGLSTDFSEWEETKNGEKYFQLLRRDYNGFGETINRIAKTVGAYSELSTDSNIRMAQHSSSYHSHKHGYGCDGIDVVSEVEKVMPLEKYLELMDETEEEIFKDIEVQFEKLKKCSTNIPNAFGVYGDYLNNRLVSLPDAFVLTSNLFVSFLRKGAINTNTEEVNHWNRNTELRTEPYVHLERISDYNESPFGMNVTINSRYIDATGTIKDFKERSERITKEIGGELLEVKTTMKLMEPILAKLNGFHNELFSERIDGRKKLRMSA